MRKLHLGSNGDLISPAHPVTCGRPFPYTIHREKSGFLEGRWEKRRSGMRLVVFGKNDLPFEPELVLNVILHPEFLLDPKRHGLEERSDSARRVGKISLKNAFEFKKRLIVERNAIEIRSFKVTLGQTEINGMLRK